MANKNAIIDLLKDVTEAFENNEKFEQVKMHFPELREACEKLIDPTTDAMNVGLAKDKIKRCLIVIGDAIK